MSEVYAQTAAGGQLWTQSLPARFVTAHRWDEAVLVADQAGLRLLDRASGGQRFAVGAAQILGAGVAVGHVVAAAGRAFVAGGGATVAIDGRGEVLWQERTAAPLAADGRWLFTHDRGDPTVQVRLFAVDSKALAWTASYRRTEAPPPAPPGGPPGEPPGEPPFGGPGGGPPLVDEAWSRTEAYFGPDHVAIRDGHEVRVLPLREGGTVAWDRAWPAPIAQIAVAGDLLLVGADRLTALTLAEGRVVWEAPLRGARTAVSPDGRTIVVAADRSIAALDLAGVPRWRTDLPAAVARAVPDRVTVDGDTVLVTFKPVDRWVGPLDVDVVAVALKGA